VCTCVCACVCVCVCVVISCVIMMINVPVIQPTAADRGLSSSPSQENRIQPAVNLQESEHVTLYLFIQKRDTTSSCILSPDHLHHCSPSSLLTFITAHLHHFSPSLLLTFITSHLYHCSPSSLLTFITAHLHHCSGESLGFF